MLFRDGDAVAIEGRFAGETHRVELDGRIMYRSPRLSARIDPDTWQVGEAAAEADGVVSLAPAADLYALLAGLAGSAPHLPGFSAEPGARVAHPGYEE
jgi:hypothetical protein